MATKYQHALATNASALIELLSKIEDTTYQAAGANYSKAFAYDGFNAVAIVEEFLKIMKKNPLDGGAFEELVDCVNIGLTRGNIRADQIEKTAEEGRNRIKNLIKTYNIAVKESKSKPVTLGNSTLTFTRIVSVFPYVACQLIRVGHVIPESFHCDFGSHLLPNEMKHPGFSSLIPTQGAWGEVLYTCHLAFMISFGNRINPKNKDDMKAKVVNQRRFGDAARNNISLYPNKLRVFCLRRLELTLLKHAKTYITVANTFIGITGGESFVEANMMKLVNKENIIFTTPAVETPKSNIDEE